jgi:hypothetical protein
MKEAQREGRTWRKGKRLAAEISHWKSFMETIGNDDDDMIFYDFCLFPA